MSVLDTTDGSGDVKARYLECMSFKQTADAQREAEREVRQKGGKVLLCGMCDVLFVFLLLFQCCP